MHGAALLQIAEKAAAQQEEVNAAQRYDMLNMEEGRRAELRCVCCYFSLRLI